MQWRGTARRERRKWRRRAGRAVDVVGTSGAFLERGLARWRWVGSIIWSRRKMSDGKGATKGSGAQHGSEADPWTARPRSDQRSGGGHAQIIQ